MNIQFVKCDGGRSTSTIYPTLKPRWIRRDGMRFKLVQDCCVRAISVACGISYDDAFDVMEAEPDGAVIDYERKLGGRIVNGWRIDLIKRWHTPMTRNEFPKLFPSGRFLCGEHGGRHLVAYIDGVRYDEGLRELWRMVNTWGLTRAVPPPTKPAAPEVAFRAIHRQMLDDLATPEGHCDVSS